MASKSKIKVGPPRLTRFERSRVIGNRALQLSMGAPPLIELPSDTTDPILIAEFELRNAALPITIERRLPRGDSQNIPLRMLIDAEEEQGKL
ncbi:MAG: DNA-directed RNA polymerase subunit K [Candidatus Ranarchaeia archaeon]